MTPHLLEARTIGIYNDRGDRSVPLSREIPKHRTGWGTIIVCGANGLEKDDEEAAVLASEVCRTGKRSWNASFGTVL